jgi:mitochondrial fission protein ELM1
MEQTPALALDSARIWTLTDGNAGNVRQAQALARALAFDGSAKHWKLVPHAPWRWWAPRRGPAAGHAFGAAFAQALLVPPEVALGCGRQAALATRLLRQQGAKTVQILDPRIDPRHWDLVIVPEHDGLQGSNVVHVLGSLNPVDDAWLMEARRCFASFADLPQPRTAVLLGGSSAHARFDRGAFEMLAAKLEVALARDGGSLLITTSRRTSGKVIAPLRRRFIETPGVVWCGEGDGPNPYAGLLAWADRIVCSPDSVNMISEACATQVPVHVFDPARVRGRPRRFLDALLRSGRIRAMDGTLADFEAEPLRETARVAFVVRERLGLS